MKTIKQAIKARKEEIELFDVNIFNYEHAIESIEGGGEYGYFKEELQKRLEAEKHQKGKAEIILSALLAQKKAKSFFRWR